MFVKSTLRTVYCGCKPQRNINLFYLRFILQKSTNPKHKHISIKYEPSLLKIVAFFRHFLFFNDLLMNCGWVWYTQSREEFTTDIFYFHSCFVIPSWFSSLPFRYVWGFFQQFVAFLCLTTKQLQPRPGLVSNKLKQMHINRQSLFYFSCSCSLPTTLQRSCLSRSSEVGDLVLTFF